MNWKVRFKNPIFVVGTFIPAMFLFAQLLLSFISGHIVDIGFSITDDMVEDALGLINLFAFAVFGITAPVDFTTKGFKDSIRAKMYNKPSDSEEDIPDQY